MRDGPSGPAWLRMVAQYADGCNIFGDVPRVRHLLGVLDQHCENVGRDPGEITKTRPDTLVIAPTHEAAEAKLQKLGIEGFTLTIPDVHDLETVELAGRTLGPLFSE